MAPTCTAAPWSSTLKQHPAAAPPASSQSGHATLTAAPCSVQQRPSHSTLAARVGYSTYPPCSTLKHHPLQQHQQASSTAPSSSTFHRHPLTSMPAPKQGLQHTPLWQQHLQTSPSGSTCSSTLSATSIAPNCTHHFDSKTLHQHLAAALQRHHDARSKARTPLWQQHAQRQQHASSRALHVWYNYQQLKHFRGKCG